MGSPPPLIQLLRAGLFPGTISMPRTAATFDSLRMFQMLSFVSKLSGWEYIRALSRLTDNAGSADITVSVMSGPSKFNN